MTNNLLAKILLAPFSFLYGVAISARNLMYETGILRATKFNLPIFSVGNLSIGGAGKTPHIEYLINLLKPYLNVATLSRGYKRKTKGFRFINPSDDALIAGDEPLMYKRKFPDIAVAVAESRTLGIPLMVQQYPNLQAILLDDAFQHRAVVSGLNILLTQFGLPFTDDFLLPSGRLREWRSAYKRADIIIVTKCPLDITEEIRQDAIKAIKPLAHQRIFFSNYSYFEPYSFLNPDFKLPLDKDLDVILISAIANTDYLVDYLERVVGSTHQMEYEDHHLFTERDIEYIESVYKHRDKPQKVIITTEKDAMRLDLHRKAILEKSLPIFVLPIKVNVMFDEQEDFDNIIKDFLLNFKS